MKKINFLLLTILTICISFTSCKDASNKETLQAETTEKEAPKEKASPSENLTGKWVLQDMDTKMEKEEKGMKEFMDAMKKEFIGKLYYEFKADKTVATYMPPIMGSKAKTQNGTWSLSPDNKTITIIDGERKENFTITSLDQKKLAMTMSSEGRSNPIMTFTKE